MTDSQIILTPKKWVKTGYYVTAPFFIAMSIFLLYTLLIGGSDERTPYLFNLSLIISAIIILIAYVASLPFFHRFHIKISENGIEQIALRHKTIPYDTIRKISIGKGFIEVKGSSFANKISFGDLYTNFDEAAIFLSENIKDQDGITFKGRDKYLKKFLPKIVDIKK